MFSSDSRLRVRGHVRLVGNLENKLRECEKSRNASPYQSTKEASQAKQSIARSSRLTRVGERVGSIVVAGSKPSVVR
jgi:hypothetical protein